MDTLILDYSKWRCGGDYDTSEFRIGEGQTLLLNEQGYMCCLGQFSMQLNPELNQENILIRGVVSQLNVDVGILTIRTGEGWIDSYLARKAMVINDNEDINTEERIQALRELFLKNGYEIQVINKPENEEITV